MSKSMIRYAITGLSRNGQRVLCFNNRASSFNDTKTEAGKRLLAIKSDPHSKEILFGMFDKIRIDEIECYNSGESKHIIIIN